MQTSKKLNKINFLKISLSISLIGILVLLFLANTLQPKLINLQEINNKLLNQKVQVQGQITSIKTYDDSNFQVISIKDKTGKIDATINQILNLTISQNITITGKITEYKGSLQIQADKITSP